MDGVVYKTEKGLFGFMPFDLQPRCESFGKQPIDRKVFMLLYHDADCKLPKMGTGGKQEGTSTLRSQLTFISFKQDVEL